jgi:hypothetical protein
MITGWITPYGKVIETKPYEHFGEFNDQVLKDLWLPYKEEIDSAYDCVQENIEADEHPEWHIYEICESDCITKAYEDAYKLGYLRLSPWIYLGELLGIAVQGLPQWIESHKTIIKELADRFDAKIRTFPATIRKERY